MADEKFAVHAEWLVEVSDTCNCGTPTGYPHMPECGMTPIASLEEIFEALREHAERVVAEEVAMRAPIVLYVPNEGDEADEPEWRDMIARAREQAGDAGVLLIPQAVTTQGGLEF